jgi:hypothetical protein
MQVFPASYSSLHLVFKYFSSFLFLSSENNAKMYVGKKTVAYPAVGVFTGPGISLCSVFNWGEQLSY